MRLFSLLCILFAPLFSQAATRIPKDVSHLKVLCHFPEIYLVDSFLDPSDCDHIVKKALPFLQKSTVVDETGKSHGVEDRGRTSSGMVFFPMMRDSILQNLENKIAELTQLPNQNGEWIQVSRYRLYEEYRPHYDFFYTHTPGGKATLKRGGQRVATCILYLKEPSYGGETVFPLLEISIPPKKGSLLVFYNCDPMGVEMAETLHCSLPVIEGEKWIATRWIREHTFH